MNSSKLKSALEAGSIEWERHVLERLVTRRISQAAVIRAVRMGELIEDYPDDHPYPSALFLGWIENKPLHVVAALNEAEPKVFMITAYEPDLEYFEPDFKTRRRK